MKIMWDEPKRLANLSKHGLDFRHLDETFFDDALVRPTHSRRWRAIGMSVHGVIAVIFVALGLEAISVISMRPASKQERNLYAEQKEGL
jgi:uncharacterized DUF497 family protein